MVYVEQAFGIVAVDVSVTDISTPAVGDGQAWRYLIARRERRKHARYPGPELVPFVVDVRGRWGREAEAWLKRTAKRYAGEEGVKAQMRTCRYAVGTALQVSCAEQLACASGL